MNETHAHGIAEEPLKESNRKESELENARALTNVLLYDLVKRRGGRDEKEDDEG